MIGAMRFFSSSVCAARGVYGFPMNLWAFLLMVTLVYPARVQGSEPIKIGLLRSMQNGPVFLAQEKGYFTAQGLRTELVFLDAAQPIPQAVASHELDFAAAGTTATLYRLAAEGSVRIIAGVAHEMPGFHLYGLAASDRAYQAGLKAYKNLPGHSVAISTIGAPAHYSLALIAQRYQLNISDVNLAPLQSYADMVSEVSAGRTDAGIIPATDMMPALRSGALHLIGWIGDVVPWQVSVVMTASSTADRKADQVARFLRAYRRGTRDYHEAFIGPNGKRRDGPTATDALAIIAKYVARPAEQITQDIAYVDSQGRLDISDVRRQMAWYKSQGMAPGPISAEVAIDRRYVIPLRK